MHEKQDEHGAPEPEEPEQDEDLNDQGQGDTEEDCVVARLHAPVQLVGKPDGQKDIADVAEQLDHDAQHERNARTTVVLPELGQAKRAFLGGVFGGLVGDRGGSVGAGHEGVPFSSKTGV